MDTHWPGSPASRPTARVEGAPSLGPPPDLLDPKTTALISLAVAAAVRGDDSVCVQVDAARATGASRDEVAAAILAALPITGSQQRVYRAVASALAAYEARYRGGRD